MEISRADIEGAVEEGVITGAQAERLWSVLERRAVAEPAPASLSDATRPRFDMVHVAYYFGALIVIGAMGWFMSLGWERFGGAGIFAISSGYALCFVLAGRTLWNKEGLKIPGGLLVAMAVAMTPLGIYGLERWMGWWPEADPGSYSGFHEWVKGGWFLMELCTITAALVALRFFRFPFLTAVIAFTLWYVSMDLAPLLFHGYVSWNERALTSAAVGFAMLVVAYLVDRRTPEDFAFWLYLFGLAAFWGGLSSMQSGSELRKFFYLLVSLGLMVTSVLLARRVFIVFGALGVCGYLGHLAHEVFRDSMLFPFALSLIGVALIAWGVHAHRHRAGYARVLMAWVPERVRRSLPSNRTPS